MTTLDDFIATLPPEAQQAIVQEARQLATKHQRETIRVLQARTADQDAKILQLEHRIISLEHRANDAQRAGNVVATWSHTIDDLMHALVFAQAKASRPQPSAEWRIYRYADCPMCGVWRSRIPMRFLDDVWWLDCPQCGEQQWRAR